MSKGEQAIIDRILNDSSYEYLKRLAVDLKTEWRENRTVKETAFLTLRAAIEHDARCDALDSFFETLERRYSSYHDKREA